MDKLNKTNTQTNENDVHTFSFVNSLKSIKLEEKDGVKVVVSEYHHDAREKLKLQTFSLKDNSLSSLYPDIPSLTKYGIHTKSMLETLSIGGNSLLKAFIHPDAESMSRLSQCWQHSHQVSASISSITSGINNLASQYLSGEIFTNPVYHCLHNRNLLPIGIGLEKSITYVNSFSKPLIGDLLGVSPSLNKQNHALADYQVYNPLDGFSYSPQGAANYAAIHSSHVVSSLAEITANYWSTSMLDEEKEKRVYQALPVIPRRNNIEERLSKLEVQMLKIEKDFAKANDREERASLKMEVEQLRIELQFLKEYGSNEESAYIDKYDVMKILNISERTYYRYKDNWKSYKVGAKHLYKELEIRQAINQFLK